MARRFAGRRILWLVALCVLALGARADVRIVGTDLLGLEFSKALYDVAGRHQLRLALAFDGSRPGLEQLQSGRADAALAALPENESVPAAFPAFIIAYQHVVVLAPAACPLAHVTLEQLAGIYAENHPAPIAHWGELSVGGDWSAHAIVAAAPAAGASFAGEFFRHTVLHDRDVKSTVRRYDAPEDLAEWLAGGSRMLAIAAVPPADLKTAKLLPIAAHAGGPAFLPTRENLYSGDYPLRLPVRLLFRREAVAKLRPLLRFLVGDDGAPHLERAGVMALPASARAQQLMALEKW